MPGFDGEKRINRSVHKGPMNPIRNTCNSLLLSAGLVVLILGSQATRAQECYSGSEIDPPTANALRATAQRYLSMSAQGDVANLKANAVPDVAANFGSIEQAVVGYKAQFAQGPPSETRMFVLDATNSKTTWQRAEFYCGIYNSPNRVGLAIPNLPPGRFALTIATVPGKEPITLTMVLQDTGQNTWKLAGYYARLNALGGRDGQWFESKGTEYKQKGQLLNAWFYYLTAWDLLAPVDFISTPALDRLSDEMQAARPAGLPTADAPLQLAGGGKTFKVIEISAVPVNGELYFRAQYDSPSAGNPQLASQDNTALIKALVAKYPEIKEAFFGVIARATDSAGHQFVTLTGMKELK